MGRIGVWLARVLVVLGLVAVAVLLLALWSSERELARRFVVADPPLPAVDAGGLAHGEHLFRSRGCSDCHGERGEGRLVFEAPPLRMVASNLTPAGAGRHYDVDAFGRAIRHGVGHDGRSLMLMPVLDYAELSDPDTAALAAWLATLPAVEHDPGRSAIHLPGRLLHLFGQLDLVPAAGVDHRPRRRAAPEPAPTVAYGEYLARTCSGCHGSDYRGGRVAGTPPTYPPASDLAALDGWAAPDFVRVMREGLRPDGRDLHPLMPWQAFRTMTDQELSALWLYFSRLHQDRRQHASRAAR
jgi:mono/diheme cytochrome c family protein